MAPTAGPLGSLLTTQADISYYTLELSKVNAQYEGNLAQLEKQQKYEAKWIDAYDKAKDGSRTSALKMNGHVFIDKETEATDIQAEQWADYKVEEYDEETLLELADLDIEYETRKTMLETMLQELRAKEESETALVQQNAPDTGLVNGG